MRTPCCCGSAACRTYSHADSHRPHPRSPGCQADTQAKPDEQGVPAACTYYAPLAVEALKDEAFQHVMVVDCERIVKDWPREAASRTLGPVAKPVTRVLQKLNPSACTLAAFGPRSVHTLLKLAAHKALPETTERLVLFGCNMRGLPAHLRQVLTGSPEPLVGDHVAITILDDGAGGDSGWSDIAAGFAAAPTFESLQGRGSGVEERRHIGCILHGQRLGAGMRVPRHNRAPGGVREGEDEEDEEDEDETMCRVVEVEFNISWKTKHVHQTVNLINEFLPSSLLSAPAESATDSTDTAPTLPDQVGNTSRVRSRALVVGELVDYPAFREEREAGAAQDAGL